MKAVAAGLLVMVAAGRALAAPLLPVPDAPDLPEDWAPRVEEVLSANAADGAGEPLTAPMAICVGTACAALSAASLDPPQAEDLRALFAGGAADAAGEREVLGRAIAFFETVVGAQTGTWRDLPGNARDDFERPGQLDCVSEAANTTTYLRRLEQAGLMTRHRLVGFVTRFTVILQHVAVELEDVANGERWVVDSWPGANGEAPDIEPYGDWRLEWRA